jgi:hypothetical protein
MAPPHQAASARGLEHLRLEQARPGHPAGPGCRASALAPRGLHPVPEMRHDGAEVLGIPIAQKEWHPTGRQELSELMQPDMKEPVD